MAGRTKIPTPIVGERYYAEFGGKVFLCRIVAVSEADVMWKGEGIGQIDSIEDFFQRRRAILAPPEPPPWWKRIFTTRQPTTP